MGESVTAPGWCIDFDRFISTGSYDMDVFTAFDSDIHSDAVDKPQFLPNLAWMINNIEVGDDWAEVGGDYVEDGCVGTIGWLEYQAAVWKTIDDRDGVVDATNPDDMDTENLAGYSDRVECIANGISAMALAEGNDYVPDCTNPDEQIPLILIVDKVKADGSDEIQNQVIMSETLLSSLDGICECVEKEVKTVDETTPPKSPSPTDVPTKAPTTDAPTDAPTKAPTTDGPTASPTKAPTPAETSDPEPVCEEENMTWIVNHDLAQSTQELTVEVQAFPDDADGTFF